MSKRPKFETPPVYLRSPKELEYLKDKLSNIPLDAENPLEVLIREQPKKRTRDLNAAYWAGTLSDIEKQARFPGPGGLQLPKKIWHNHFKDLYLPDEIATDFDPSHVLDGYCKWERDPWSDTMILVGSTTDLTQKGMRFFVLQVESEMSGKPHEVRFMERAR